MIRPSAGDADRGGQAFPKSRRATNKADRSGGLGFESTIDSIATWFNRLVAIRYMGSGYLDHGYRVLSRPDGEAILSPGSCSRGGPAAGSGQGHRAGARTGRGALPSAAYGPVQCLHDAMPFLFEQIKDETNCCCPPTCCTDSLIQLVERSTKLGRTSRSSAGSTSSTSRRRRTR